MTLIFEAKKKHVMTKHGILLLLLATLGTVLLSCDDEKEVVSNQLTIGETSTPLSSILISNVRGAGGIGISIGKRSAVLYNYDIWFTGNGVMYNAAGGNLEGTGKFLSLVVQSSEYLETGLPEGTFTLTNEGLITVEADALANNANEYIGGEASTGSLTVAKSGSSYTVTLSAVILDDANAPLTVTANFTGAIANVNQ